MKVCFVRMIGAMCLLLCARDFAFAQNDGYRRLTADDFMGVPQVGGNNAIAYTNCSIHFRYQAYRENGSYRLVFDVPLVMNREKSWMDKTRITSQKMLAEVLKHEQGHYNIAYMEQQEILREAARTRFDYNYQAEASALFNRIHAKYQVLNANYDADTRHMVDANQQHSWDVYFQRKLAYMPPVSRADY